MTSRNDSFRLRLSDRFSGFDSFSLMVFLAFAPTTKPRDRETPLVAFAESFPETGKRFRLLTTT